ncbi:MAG: adenosylcobinamide-GDP ribazoletransferase [Pararhodobacter sp.]|nr:adenosylcobinamide-GDP ribazoletransferase [Pararhodobacter sp.]
MRSARAALAFLTRLPAGPLNSADFAHAPGWFAAVGLLIGGLQALVFVVAASLWSPVLAALVAVAAGLVITGALHEDGLADMVDGLGSGRPRDRALEIMRDSRIGSFGALALGLALAMRVAALAGLGPLAPVMLVAAAALSRGVMALLLRAGPYLRPSGAGSGMTGPMGASGLALAGAAAGALALIGWSMGAAVLGGLLGLVLGAGGTRLWAMRRLGGLTGDVLGAAQVLGEVGFLMGVLACL